MANDGTVKIGTDLDESGLKKGLSQVGGLAKQGFSAMGSAAATMAKTATAAIGGMVTAIGGAGAAAYKFGTEYETSAAKVSTIADTTKVSMEELGDAVLNLSNETGTAATELNEALYSAISAGADTAHAVDLVEVAVKAARGGFTDTETAVDGLTSALNAYGMETSDAEGLANKFLVTQNLGKTTFGELASSIGGVAPTANAAGVSIDELLSGVASLTANGIGTSEAMTGIKAALSNVIKPSSEAAKMAAQLGLDFSTAALQSKGLAGFLDDVSTATGGNMDQMAQLFGSVEALNTVLTLTSEQGSTLMNETLDEMASNTTALDDAYEAMSNTAEIHMQKIGNSFKNLGIAMYQDTKGPIADFTGQLSDAAEDIATAYSEGGFSGMAEQIGTSFAEIATEIASMAPGLIDAGVSLIQNFIGGLMKNRKKLSEAGVDIAKSLASGILEIVPDMAVLAISFLASFVQGIAEHTPELMKEAGAAMYDLLNAFYEYFPDFMAAGEQLLKKLVDGISQAISGDGAQNAASMGVEILTQLVNGVVNAIPQLIPLAQQILVGLLNAFTENIGMIISQGVLLLTSLIEGISQALPGLIPAAVEAVLALVEALTDPDTLGNIIDAGIQLLIALADGIVNALPSLIEKAPVIIENICSALKENFPKLIEAGFEILSKLIAGIIENLPEIVTATLDIIDSIWDTIINIDWIELGASILRGILSGLSNIGSAAWEAIKKVGNSIKDGFLDFFDIHSPSRLMRDLIGRNVIAGVGVGFEMETDNLENQAQSTMQKAVDAMQKIDAKRFVGDMQLTATQKSQTIASDFTGRAQSSAGFDYERLGRTIGNSVKEVARGQDNAGNEYIILNIDGQEIIRWIRSENETHKIRTGGETIFD